MKSGNLESLLRLLKICGYSGLLQTSIFMEYWESTNTSTQKC